MAGPAAAVVELRRSLLCSRFIAAPKAVLEKMVKIQTIDVWYPIPDGRHLVMSRCNQPELDQSICQFAVLLLSTIKYIHFMASIGNARPSIDPLPQAYVGGHNR